MDTSSHTRPAACLCLLVASLATCHAQTPFLQTGGATTNVVAVIEQPPIARENAHVDIRLAWQAHPQAHGFGIIRFAPNDQFEGGAPSILFTASGFWRVIRPDETPTVADFAPVHLDGEGQYALKFRVYTGSSTGAHFAGDYAASWRGTKLSQDDFRNAKCVLSGRGIEIISLSHKTALSNSLLLIR